MAAKIFVTGIGTDVGKTVVSAVLVEALKADYWKPVQAGDLEYSDTHKVKEMVANNQSQFFENAYSLKYPMSPHASADREGLSIDLDKIVIPETENYLIIEGAGGLMVPLNHQSTLMDWLPKGCKTILVSKNYLGSINHTLLSIDALKNKGADLVGLIISGDANIETEEIIEELSGTSIIARVPQLNELNKRNISEIAEGIRDQVKSKL